MSATEPDRESRRRRHHWFLRAIAAAFAAVLLFSLVVVILIPVKIPESGSRQRVLFYAAPTDLSPGRRISSGELKQRLDRLDYHPVVEPSLPGEYRLDRTGGVIGLRPFSYPGRSFPGGRLRLRLRGDEILSVEPLDPLEPADLRLEPERIAGFEGKQGAVLKPLRLAEAPPLLVDAILACEDRRFYRHPGIDPIGTLRAALRNLRRREPAQGGSTLTQQLARSLFLRNQKTILRKAVEAVLAVGLEVRYSKREILEAYLNAVYLGTWGPMEIRGVREASQYYLGCDIQEADPAGIALLVALIPAPNVFSPYRHPELARKRRDLVLRTLERRGVLTAEEAKKAAARPLQVKQAPVRATEASYFLAAAREEIERRAPEGTLLRPGTRVFTTLDPHDQAAAVLAVQRGLNELERGHRKLRRKDDPLQAAVVSIDPETGGVRALVGGRDFLLYPYNRATEARRQPGSLFKPFVYLAAFQHPQRSDGTYWTPLTQLQDEPYAVRAGRRIWRPRNYDRSFRGPVTLRHALEQSLNVPTARVAVEVGIGRVAEVARDLGVQSPLREVPSLSLGTSEVSLVEITSAYAALANRGEARAPHLVFGLLDDQGKEVPLAPLADPPGIDRREAFLITSLLRGVMASGTGKQARQLGVRGDVAGKTGTTDDYRDAWFVGYTPQRAIGVWVGFDQNHPVGLSGGAAGLPIWALAMRAAAGRDGDGSFERPRGIARVAVCLESGQLATVQCPEVIEEDFLSGTAPEEDCQIHQPDIITRFRDWLGF